MEQPKQQPSEKWTLQGKYVIVTGATSGIGLAAAKALVSRGASVGIVARNAVKAEDVATELRGMAAPAATIDVFLADMESQRSIRQAAGQILAHCPRIDVLVNNAGAMFAKRELTEDRLEKTWAVNHLGPFLLTTLLLQRLKESSPARIITTTSHGHKMARKGILFDDLSAKGYYSFPGSWTGGPNFRYGETKLANILFTTVLAERTAGTGISAACFDPGLVATNFNQNNGAMASMTMAIMKRFSISPEQGAETLVWLAESDEMSTASGHYYKEKQRVAPAAAAQDRSAATRLWELSEQQVQNSGG